MATMLGEMTVEEAAREAAGNWRGFINFIWDRARDLDDPDEWAVIYTHNRDSGLLDQSNASLISKALEPYSEADGLDVVFENHGHWAVGYVEGFSVRVYREGDITDAFTTYHELAERLAEYPILDESDYSEREHEATIENIADAAWRLKSDYELPDGWEGDVYAWLSENRSSGIENRDDRGGYPEEDDLRAAFEALGFERVE